MKRSRLRNESRLKRKKEKEERYLFSKQDSIKLLYFLVINDINFRENDHLLKYGSQILNNNLTLSNLDKEKDEKKTR